MKADQVQGTSFEVGDKVLYEGREMLSQKARQHGDIKMVDLSGVKALADGIPSPLPVKSILTTTILVQGAKMLRLLRQPLLSSVSISGMTLVQGAKGAPPSVQPLRSTIPKRIGSRGAECSRLPSVSHSP